MEAAERGGIDAFQKSFAGRSLVDREDSSLYSVVLISRRRCSEHVQDTFEYRCRYTLNNVEELRRLVFHAFDAELSFDRIK